MPSRCRRSASEVPHGNGRAASRWAMPAEISDQLVPVKCLTGCCQARCACILLTLGLRFRPVRTPAKEGNGPRAGLPESSASTPPDCRRRSATDSAATQSPNPELADALRCDGKERVRRMKLIGDVGIGQPSLGNPAGSVTGGTCHEPFAPSANGGGIIRVNSLDVWGSVVDGPGIRTVVFLQGCSRRCAGCHNPQTWDFEAGHTLSVCELAQSIHAACRNRRLTISGGEPLEQAEQVGALIDLLPEFEVTLYTGHQLEAVPVFLLAKVRYLKVGEYRDEERTSTEPYIGSRNQRFIDLGDRRDERL